VRAGKELLLERLRRQHLAACRPDRVVELRQKPAPRAVRRNDHMLGVELVERFDPPVLFEGNSCIGG
jgi:hypothetical protein